MSEALRDLSALKSPVVKNGYARRFSCGHTHEGSMFVEYVKKEAHP